MMDEAYTSNSVSETSVFAQEFLFVFREGAMTGVRVDVRFGCGRQRSDLIEDFLNGSHCCNGC